MYVDYALMQPVSILGTSIVMTEQCVMFFAYCAYPMDYHWGCHLYFVILSYHAQTMTHNCYLS
jgi:hypothetical protein